MLIIYEKMMHKIKIIKVLQFGVIAISAAATSVIAINLEEIRNADGMIYTNAESIEPAEVAIVFGAKVRGEKMSPMFEDRAISAIGLYRDKKVEKILVSGDHGRSDYDEVNAAKDYMLANGVDAEDIFTDHAGFDTYDTIYRAKEVFGARSAILVTQEFHLYRALYIAKNLKMDAVGFASDLHEYPGSWIFETREIFARVKAFSDVIMDSKPKYLGEKISISGDGRASWDN